MFLSFYNGGFGHPVKFFLTTVESALTCGFSSDSIEFGLKLRSLWKSSTNLWPLSQTQLLWRDTLAKTYYVPSKMYLVVVQIWLINFMGLTKQLPSGFLFIAWDYTTIPDFLYQNVMNRCILQGDYIVIWEYTTIPDFCIKKSGIVVYSMVTI